MLTSKDLKFAILLISGGRAYSPNPNSRGGGGVEMVIFLKYFLDGGGGGGVG